MTSLRTVAFCLVLCALWGGGVGAQIEGRKADWLDILKEPRAHTGGTR